MPGECGNSARFDLVEVAMRYGLTACLLFLSTLTLAQETPKSGVPNYDIAIHGHGDYLQTPDGKLYYEKEGQGPIAIIIAGGPGADHSSFHPFFSRLAKDHTVVYFDSIGRGRSDRLKDPSQYTVWRDAEDVERLRAMFAAEKITVIGHSYGGMPALAYAVTHPQHVDHLVLSDTLHCASGFQENINSVNFFESHQYPDHWAKLMELRKEGVKSSADSYGDIYMSGASGDSVYWYDTANAARMFHSGEHGMFNYGVYLAMIGDDPEWTVSGTMKHYDPRPQMKKLHVPTLICVGRWDRVAVPKVAMEMKNLLPADSSHLRIFEKSGHRPWIEETDLYFKTLDDFFADRLKD